MWHDTYQYWFCPARKFVAICICSLGFYGVLKLGGKLALIMGAMAIVIVIYLVTLFTKFGQFALTSAMIQRNWINSNTSGLWCKKFICSVPIFEVSVGIFYNVKKTTIFSIIGTVLNITVTLLLL